MMSPSLAVRQVSSSVKIDWKRSERYVLKELRSLQENPALNTSQSGIATGWWETWHMAFEKPMHAALANTGCIEKFCHSQATFAESYSHPNTVSNSTEAGVLTRHFNVSRVSFTPTSPAPEPVQILPKRIFLLGDAS